MLVPMRTARLLWIPGLCLWSVACGDDGRATASASDSNNPTLSDPTATQSTDSGGATESTPTDPGGSATDSQSGTTTQSTSTPSTPSSADDTVTPTDTGDTSATDTGFVPHGCDEDPPKGFMAPFDDLCATTPEVGMFNPVVEWHKDTWSMGANSKSSVSAPVVAQLTDDNGDGEITPDDMPEVLLITYNHPDAQTSCWLRAVSGDGATEVLNVQNVQFSRNQNLAVADIDKDGIVEILTLARDSKVYAYEHDGTLKWTSADLGANVSNNDAAVAVSDMNGDGNPEIIIGRAILGNDGVLVSAGTHGLGGNPSMSFAVDINNDGDQEVVVGNALFNIAGADLWFNGETDGFPAIIDLEVDGQPEIVVVPPNRVRVQRGTDGSVVWDVAVPGGLGGPPTVADFDGDGLPEVGIAGKNRYSVFDGDGTVLWSAVTQDASSGITGSSVYDFEGDGVADVVYADEVNLWVF